MTQRPANDEQPGIAWLTIDALNMADHIEADHDGNPDLVSRECARCLEIAHIAERHIEQRDECEAPA